MRSQYLALFSAADCITVAHVLVCFGARVGELQLCQFCVHKIDPQWLSPICTTSINPNAVGSIGPQNFHPRSLEAFEPVCHTHVDRPCLKRERTVNADFISPLSLVSVQNQSQVALNTIDYQINLNSLITIRW